MCKCMITITAWYQHVKIYINIKKEKKTIWILSFVITISMINSATLWGILGFKGKIKTLSKNWMLLKSYKNHKKLNTIIIINKNNTIIYKYINQ